MNGLTHPSKLGRCALLGAALLALVDTAAARSAEGIRVTAAGSMRQGDLVVLTVTTPGGVDGIRITAFGRDIPAFGAGPLTWRALVGIDLEAAAGRYPVEIEARPGRWQAKWQLVVAPRQFPTRRLQVDEGYVNPPIEAAARIREDARALQEAFSRSAPERLWSPPFVRPIPSASNSRFGALSIFNGERRSRHTGADYPSPTGTPIAAPNAGRVVLARDLYFSGNTVIIDHGLGLFSLLAHLSRVDVREGSVLATGDIVGLVGATGRVTGPHLHWAMHAGVARIDPESALAVLGHRGSESTGEARRLP